MPPKVSNASAQAKGQKSLFSFFNKAPQTQSIPATADELISTPISPSNEYKDVEAIDPLISNENKSQSPKQLPTPSVRTTSLKRVKNVLMDSDDEEWHDEAENKDTKAVVVNTQQTKASVSTSIDNLNKRARTSISKTTKSNLGDDEDDLVDSESSASIDSSEDDDDGDDDEDDFSDDDDEPSKNKKGVKKRPLPANTKKTDTTTTKKVSSTTTDIKNQKQTFSNKTTSSTTTSSSSLLAKSKLFTMNTNNNNVNDLSSPSPTSTAAIIFSPTSVGQFSATTPITTNHSAVSQSANIDTATCSNDNNNRPMIVLPEGVIGLGSHEHNTYEWLKPTHRLDKNKRASIHPDYNLRTCHVPEEYMKDQTPAMVQWWKFKSDNMDTVLFFKVGKFYELFHMDADVGMSELDLIYMKGAKAHSGFPEVSYGKFASILVSRGYRVARVEQTETPDMLKERNDKAVKGAKKDKVVTRELCSVMSKGTRTYCHLDDLTLLSGNSSSSVNDNNGTGGGNVEEPKSLLVCIKERISYIPVSSTTMDDETSLEQERTIAVPEYGVCCVDTTLGIITLAQFQDDQLRARLRTMLSQSQLIPTEVLFEKKQFSPETVGIVKLVAGSNVVLDYLRSSTPLPSTNVSSKSKTINAAAADVAISEMMKMPSSGNEVIDMIKQGRYFLCSTTASTSTKTIQNSIDNISHWPEILQAVVAGVNDGSSDLVLCALGGALWQLKRSLIDYEILSMGKIIGYAPTDESSEVTVASNTDSRSPLTVTSAAASVSVIEKTSTSSSAVNSGYTNTQHSQSSFTSFASTYTSITGMTDFDKEDVEEEDRYFNSQTYLLQSLNDTDMNADSGSNVISNSNTATTTATHITTTVSTSTVIMTTGPTNMTLDAVALANLEILQNNFDHTEKGSLWSFINHCKTAFGQRLLKQWICHPLYRIQHIKNRTNAVEELLTTFSAQANSTRSILKMVPDLERLLTRVHSNGLKKKVTGAVAIGGGNVTEDHPDTRAVMFEDQIYSSRKIKDFIDILNGFEQVLKIIDSLFINTQPRSLLLQKIVKDKPSQTNTSNNNNTANNGKFPATEMRTLLRHYREIFDEKQAKSNGYIKPKPGVDSEYDTAKKDMSDIEESLEQYLREMKRQTGINDLVYWGNNKDRYQIEVEMNKCTGNNSHKIPSTWMTKSQKKTHRRYRTPFIEEKLIALQNAEDRIEVAQKDTLRKIFEKFDANKVVWNDALVCIATLDALLSIATVSASPNYVWPVLLPPYLQQQQQQQQQQQTQSSTSSAREITSATAQPHTAISNTAPPTLDIRDGRHPMLESVFAQRGDSYIPNTVQLGGVEYHLLHDNNNSIFNCDADNINFTQQSSVSSVFESSQTTTSIANNVDITNTTATYQPRLLLLSGPNMGGKSTLLRQTCLITILAQTGFKVPASHCVLTPVDRIFTRVGASDRILSGQSTFFVELAETASMLKSATKHSLCILDELGRGTATFDGTAIAHAVVDHLITQPHCCTLFATHYHSLIEDWEMDPRVQLGHMECFVQPGTITNATTNTNTSNIKSYGSDGKNTEEMMITAQVVEAELEAVEAEEVTFLFQLKPGASPRSYGINVARLAGLPFNVIQSAMNQSLQFEKMIQKTQEEKNQQHDLELHQIISLNNDNENSVSNTVGMAVGGVNNVGIYSSQKRKSLSLRWEKIQSYFEKLVSIVQENDKYYSQEELTSYAQTLWQRYQLA